LLDLDASTIGHLYRHGWQIEIFHLNHRSSAGLYVEGLVA
jgi:hypothetical protein